MKLGILVFTSIFWGLLSCSNQQGEQNLISIENTNSPHFSISKKNDYKIICIYGSSSQDTIATYVLYHRGSKKPTLNFPAVFITTPVQRVACLSSVYVGGLNELKLLDKIIAVDNGNYILNKEIKMKIQRGQVAQIAITGNIETEKTILIKPDLVFSFASGVENDRSLMKLNDQGIPVVTCSEQLESTPLNRAAWIKVLAAFFEKDLLADSLYKNTVDRYQLLSKKTESYLINHKNIRPKVISEITYNGTWYVPGGRSFMSALFKDAGAEYFLKDDHHSGSLPLSYEAVYLRNRTADYWLNVHGWISLNDCILHDKRNAAFTAYKTGNIYNNTGQKSESGANGYWENGVFSPDEILEDLIKIFHPSILPDHQLQYYKKLL